MTFSKRTFRRVFALAAISLITAGELSAQTTNCTPAPSGLVSLWRGESNAADSVNTNKGILFGATTYTTGKVGQSFNFSGSTSYALVSNSPSLKFTNAMTVEAWIYPFAGSGRTREIVSKWEGGQNQRAYTFNIYPSGKASFAVTPDGANDFFVSSTNVIPTVAWSHLAGVYDGISLKMYVNGVLESSVPYSANIYPGNAALTIGSTLIGSYFDGLIDEASLYNRALSAGEIQNIYLAGSAGKCGTNVPSTPAAPLIVGHPNNATVTAGGNTSFAVIATGTAPLNYQWQYNAADLPGQTNSALALMNVQLTDAGNYSVLVSNVAGVAVSSNGVLTVQTPPPSPIVLWNFDFAAYQRQKTGFAVTGIGVGDLWNNLTFPFQNSVGWTNLKRSDGVVTSVGLTVENGGGHTSFSHVDLMYQTCCYAQNRGIITTTVTNLPGGTYDIYLYGHAGDSTANTVFQVLVGNNNFGNKYTATNSSWSLTNWVEGAQYVVYRDVTVTNGGAPLTIKCNPGLSGYTYLNGLQIASASPTTPTAPQITSHPTNVTVTAGANALFAVTATGTAPFSYQWRYNSTNLVGQINTALSLANVQLSDAGNYSVLVSNSIGIAISSNAVLTVLPPPVCVVPPAGLVSAWSGEWSGEDVFQLNNGTVQSGVTYTNGKVGQAFVFNGTTGGVTVPASSSLDVGAGSGFTIETWINPTSVTAGRPIVEWSRGTGVMPYGVHFWISVGAGGAGCLFANLVDTNTTYHGINSAGNLVKANTYQHAALTYDKASGVGRLFLDGNIVAESNLGTFTPKTYENFYIGLRPADGVARWSGKIDEVGVYNRALGTNEIQAIYAASSAGKCLPNPPPIAPTITTNPVDVAVLEGGIATFTVTATGSNPLTYQWRYNGTNLVGKTGTSLMLVNAQPSNAGSYSVVVSNAGGVAISSDAVLTVQTPSPTACVTAPAGLVSAWSGEGNAYDVFQSNNGTLRSGVTFANGKVGQGFSFSNSNLGVKIAAATNLNVGTGNGFTIETWINPTDVSVGHPIVEWNSGSYGVCLWLGSWGPDFQPASLYASVKNANLSDYPFVSPPNLVTPGVFQHVALTYDKTNNGKATLYLNGTMVVQTNLGSFMPFTSSDMYFGYRPSDGGAGSRFVGQMDEVALYNRALSLGEIQSIYVAGSLGKCLTNLPPLIAPSITQHPTNLTVVKGGTATFSVAATGTAPLSYQWRYNSTNLPGQNSSSLNLLNVQPSDAGNYSVVVTNIVGTAISSNAVLTVQPFCVEPPAGLVSEWSGEGNGDDVFQLNNGTVQSGVTFASGKVGQAFVFNGTTGGVAIPASSSLNVGAGSGFTIETWINPASISTGRPIIEWSRGTGVMPYGVHLWISVGAAGSLYANLVDTNTTYHDLNSGGNFVKANTYQHVALTYDKASGVGRLFLDGNIIAQNNLGTFTPKTYENLYIGLRPADGTGQWLGQIDEVGVYNRALSTNEIQAIYAASSAGKCLTNMPPIPPTITSHPTNVTVLQGGFANFAVSATGSAPLGYQWRYNGTNLAGQTGTALMLANVQASDAGDYSVAVTNLGGIAISSNAVLTVQTSSPTACVTAPAGLAASWLGEGNFDDVFQIDNGVVPSGVTFTSGKVGQAFDFSSTNTGVRIPGNTNLNIGVGNGFTIETWINPSDVATGRPIIEWNSGSFGACLWIASWDSNNARNGGLFVDLKDSALQDHPFLTPSNVLTAGVFQHVALSYEKTNGGKTRIYVNGSILVETNLGSFTPFTYSDMYLGYRPSDGGAGRRFVGQMDEVSLYNRALSPTEIHSIYAAGSYGKCLTNVPPPLVGPAITKQPTNLTVLKGGTANFTVTATGSAPLSYQWRYNSTNLVGQTNSSLSLVNVQQVNAGSYSVVVSNGAGSVTSGNAVLTVTQPTALVRVLGTNTMAGKQIEVPVILVANGDENTLSFSLSYSTQRLSFAGITLGSGAANASLLPNLAETANGRIGVAVGLGAGETFSGGTQEVVRVLFNTMILGGSTSNSTPVNITNTPVNRLLANVAAQALPANYSNAAVVLFPTDLEGDASPAPSGNRSLDIFDWVQVGRYVAGLETITNANEFQRVDCAPRDTAGDGQLKVTDWVQAGRYAVALDPLTVIGGPTAPVAPRPTQNSPIKLGGSNREVRLTQADSVNGLLVTVPVTLQSLGNESGLGLSLNFDASSLRFVSAVKGSSASAATLNVNTNAVGSGKLGLLLALPTGSSFASGAREIVKVTFMSVATTAGDYPISFVDQPILRSISDTGAAELSAGYTSSAITVHGNPTLTISSVDDNVVLSWPIWASDFALQSAESPAATWTNVTAGVQTNGADVTVSLPISTSSQFFRLAHP